MFQLLVVSHKYKAESFNKVLNSNDYGAAAN